MFEGQISDDEDEVVKMPENEVAPSMRIMVVESDYLRVGTLFLVTLSGGTIG